MPWAPGTSLPWGQATGLVLSKQSSARRHSGRYFPLFHVDECCWAYILCIDESKALQWSSKEGFSTSLGEEFPKLITFPVKYLCLNSNLIFFWLQLHLSATEPCFCVLDERTLCYQKSPPCKYLDTTIKSPLNLFSDELNRLNSLSLSSHSRFFRFFSFSQLFSELSLIFFLIHNESVDATIWCNIQ